MTEAYLVDSNVLMRFFKRKDDAVELMNLLRKRGRLVMSALSIMELQAGWTDEQTEHLFPHLLELLDVEDLTHNILQYAGTLRRNYKQKGIILQPLDTLIAATAIKNEIWMVTYNRKDFEPIKELKLYQDLFV